MHRTQSSEDDSHIPQPVEIIGKTQYSPASAPARVQRLRKRGWRMPPRTVYVGRPTIWGNPFNFKEFPEDAGPQSWARGVAVDLYRKTLVQKEDAPDSAFHKVNEYLSQFNVGHILPHCGDDAALQGEADETRS